MGQPALGSGRDRRRLRARWALPVASDPIEDAEVIVEYGLVAEARPRRVDGEPVLDARDFGDAAILPGLVNTHSHIEYTAMRGLLDDLPFFAWIRRLTALKALLDEDDWRASAILGAAEAVSGGTTTLADCTDSGAALDGLLAVGARGIIYQEVFGVDESVTVGETVGVARSQLLALRSRLHPRLHAVGLSAHSPYTVRPDLMRALGTWALSDGLPICVHAAESAAEVELIRRGSGEIADHLTGRGVTWHAPDRAPRMDGMDGMDAPDGTDGLSGGTKLLERRPISSVAHLHTCGVLGPRTLLVHGTNVSASDGPIIAEAGASWAHCPRSNAMLGTGIAPLGWMAACSSPPRVGIGTDSVVSAGSMDMFEEMRFALMLQRASRRNGRTPTARRLLELATIGGARALGLSDRVGALIPGLEADITVLGLRGPRYEPVNDVTAAVVNRGTAHDVLLTMVAGREVYDAGTVIGDGIASARKRVAECAARLTAAVRSHAQGLPSA